LKRDIEDIVIDKKKADARRVADFAITIHQGTTEDVDLKKGMRGLACEE
jgi:hypothetical protein